MKKWIWTWILLTGIFVVQAAGLYAQTPMIYYPEIKGASSFYYDVITLATDDSTASRVRVYTKIAYDDLQFVKQEEGYYAKYELSVTLFDRRGNQVDGDIRNYDVAVTEFDQTNSRHDFCYSENEFTVPPDDYELLISLMDQDSKKSRHWKGALHVPKYRKKDLEMSTLILADSIATDQEGHSRVVLPNVIGNYEEDNQSILAWFEIYSSDKKDSVLVGYRVLDTEDKPVLDQKYWKIVSDSTVQEVIQIDRTQLKSGRYQLEVVLGKGAQAIKQSRNVSIHWLGMPSHASNMDDAIEQIRYVASGKEIKKIKQAEDKYKAFQQFWKEKDPSPTTEENELMEEYYRRINHANRNFDSMMDGWKTDRGMVYIILGSPDDIERHPFEIDSKPYIIWYYYQLDRQFVFVDYTGFGDYRLTRPFWETMGRLP